MIKRKSDKWYNPLDVKVLDELGRKTFWEKPSSDFEEIEKFLKLSNRILEVWTWTGRLWIQIIERGYCYTWIERQKRFLEIFKEKLSGIRYDPEKVVLIHGDFEELPEDTKYDVILFPWTIIWDFTKQEQIRVLEKALRLLTDNEWIILIDNPAKTQKYNTVSGYEPTPFYYDEWKEELSKIWFEWHEAYVYQTKTWIKRELTILSVKEELTKLFKNF